MITIKSARSRAAKLPDMLEKDHFGSDAFYANKKIFATFWEDKGEVNVKLTPALQSEFVAMDENAFFAIDNAWGRQGWTTIQLETVNKQHFQDALQAAWNSSALKVSRPKPRSKTSARRKIASKKKSEE